MAMEVPPPAPPVYGGHGGGRPIGAEQLRHSGSFEAAVMAVIRALGPGEVASYGEVAEEAGFAGAARAVGNLLASNEGLPWWRVVRADGRLVSPHQEEQARLLEKEGIDLVGGRSSGDHGRAPEGLHALSPSLRRLEGAFYKHCSGGGIRERPRGRVDRRP